MKSILIVDDEVDIANSIQYVLKQEGFSTLMAHDGLKAMELYEHQRPDMVILDLMMPGIDGYEVCRRVRATDKKTPKYPAESTGRQRPAPCPLEAGTAVWFETPDSRVSRRTAGR